MIPDTEWRRSPQAAREAWRKWVRAHRTLDITSEAFVAGAMWAYSQEGQTAIVQELAEMREAMRRYGK